MDARRTMLTGAAAGTAAAALMLPLFAGATRVGLLSKPPPARVVDRAVDAVDAGPDASEAVGRDERGAATLASHLLYGAGAGAVYGPLGERLSLPALVAGPAYGVLLWAVGYLGWMPAAGVLPRPWRQPTGDALVPIAAHLVYGLALGLADRALRPR